MTTKLVVDLMIDLFGFNLLQSPKSPSEKTNTSCNPLLLTNASCETTANETKHGAIFDECAIRDDVLSISPTTLGESAVTLQSINSVDISTL